MIARCRKNGAASWGIACLVAAVACGEVTGNPDGGGADTEDAGEGSGDVGLSVVIEGSGSGSVTSEPGAIDCPGTCSEELPEGTELELTAEADGESRLASWSASGCEAAPACEVVLDGDLEITVTFELEPNVAFVTSTVTGANFGGLAEADAICAARAEDAGLDGTYVAWLSTEQTDAVERLEGASGWVRTDGAPFADTPEGLASGEIFHPLRLDEVGEAVPPPELFSDVWTGTDQDGLADNFTCADWTGTNGNAQAGTTTGTTGIWTARTNSLCSGEKRLYCFGLDRAARIDPGPPGERIAFVTEDKLEPGPEGLTAADALCAAEADVNGLEGEFLALLATQDTSAIERVGTEGPVWTRPDGVAIADDMAAFLAGPFWSSTISQTASGEYFRGTVWTGADGPSDTGTESSTCEDWTSVTPSGTVGRASDVRVAEAFDSGRLDCNLGRRLYCVQE